MKKIQMNLYIFVKCVYYYFFFFLQSKMKFCLGVWEIVWPDDPVCISEAQQTGESKSNMFNSQIQEYKYRNTNTRIQIQEYNYRNTNTNTQIQLVMKSIFFEAQ